jgi:hypothetical protein
MRTGIRPRVNEAREYLEVAKDFKDAREIIREALSNSWDANAQNVSVKFFYVPISGTRKKRIDVEITDDGDGMNDAPRTDGPSEIESFFNLGDSYKPTGSIGSKGHGTKIYYKSEGIYVTTWKKGKKFIAETEVPPWDALLSKNVPTYRYDEIDEAGNGTVIKVKSFQAKPADFKDLQALIQYIQWYTVMGSFAGFFGETRKMQLALKPLDGYQPVKIDFGFQFPEERQSTNSGDFCKIFGPRTIDAGQTEDGKSVKVEIIGAILGEQLRAIVPETYTHMGLWLCKDYMRIERKNELLEQVLGGQYYYRSFLIFANCQEFDLTANRNNIRTDQSEYDLAIEAIKNFVQEMWEDEATKSYFELNKTEDEAKRSQRERQEREEKIKQLQQRQKDRLNRYKAREDLNASGVKSPIRKVPCNEAETALLLQAMISSGHPEIDFTIGEYNTTQGVDLTIEKHDKGIDTIRWAEIVFELANLYAWPHPPEGYHTIICYQLGDVKEHQAFGDGSKSQLVKGSKRGRHQLLIGASAIEIYVLRELLS